MRTGAPKPAGERPLRIVHVIESLGLGGAEVLLAQALPRLVEAGHEVRLRAVSPPDTLASGLTAQGVDTSTLLKAPDSRTSAFALAAFRLRQELARAPADIVHTHLFNASLVARAAVLGLRRRPRLVTSLHNPDYRSLRLEGFDARRIRRHAVAEWSSAVLANDAMVAVSKAVLLDYERQYRRLGVFGRIELIHNAIDVAGHVSRADATDVAAARAAWGCRPGQFVIVSVGRLTFQKNYALLLDAVAALGDLGVDVRAIVLGGGPELTALQGRHESRVVFAGSQPRERVMAALAACDVYVQPSRYEAFGIAILEAMASSRPVVASSVDGISELVADGETGRLFPSEDLPAFVAALREVAASRALGARWGEAGRARAAAQFDISTWVSRTLDLYRRLCASR